MRLEEGNGVIDEEILGSFGDVVLVSGWLETDALGI